MTAGYWNPIDPWVPPVLVINASHVPETSTVGGIGAGPLLSPPPPPHPTSTNPAIIASKASRFIDQPSCTGLPLPGTISRIAGQGENSFLGIQKFQDSVWGEEGQAQPNSKILRRPRKGSYIIAVNFGGGPTPPPDCEVNCEVDPAYPLRKDTKMGEPVSRFPRLFQAPSCFCLLHSVHSGRS